MFELVSKYKPSGDQPNAIKELVKGIKDGKKEETLEKHGAVSEEVVREMAIGCRTATLSDLAVVTSGVAGPGGGSNDKPVGLVWIGVSSQDSTETYSMVFKGDRKRNIERFAANALNILRKKLVNEL